MTARVFNDPTIKAEGQHEPSTATRRLLCPNCQCPNMRRVARRGFLKRTILPLFGYYPWECSTCRIEKLFKHRGARRKHGATAQELNQPESLPK